MLPRYFKINVPATNHYLQLLFALFTLYMTTLSTADIITMNNGDQINGELVKLEGEHIHWASDNFGILMVATANISKLETAQVLKINGHKDGCTLTGMSRGRMLYSCGDDKEYSNQVRSVKTLMPYADFIQGDHSYRGKVRAAGDFANGNTNLLDWNIDIDMEFRQGDFRQRMAAVYDSRSRDSDPVAEIFDLQYQLDIFFHQRWFSYNKISYGIDEPKNIEEQFNIGSGMGYQLWDNDLTALSVVTGLGYTKRNFDSVDELDEMTNKGKDESINWRGGIDFRYRLPLSIGLFHRNEILWSLSESDSWQFDSETGILIPLGAGLFSDLKIEYDYDNSLRTELSNKSDTRIKVGLGYEW